MELSGLYADRIGGKHFGTGTQLYKFEKIKAVRRRFQLQHPDVRIIDLGVGEPDEMADPAVVEALYKAAKDPGNRGYTDNGIIEFKEAAAGYMESVYRTGFLDARTEITHGIGSKSILAILPMAFINPGDILLQTVPGYPVMATSAEALGGETVDLPLRRTNSFLPDLSVLTAEQRRRAKMLYINYPNNPTGADASEEFYRQVIDFAGEHEIIVVSDEAYAAIVHHGRKPLSFMSVPGAKEVGVSVQSLSKAFNMTGWRLGFLAGNKNIIEAFKAVKNTRDSGQFAAVQHAGVYCLNHPEITERTSLKYSQRLEKLISLLKGLGVEAEMPAGTFYLYIPVPRTAGGGREFSSAEEFSLYLLSEYGIVTVPWDEAGMYIRLSATWQSEKEASILKELGQRLRSVFDAAGRYAGSES